MIHNDQTNCIIHFALDITEFQEFNHKPLLTSTIATAVLAHIRYLIL